MKNQKNNSHGNNEADITNNVSLSQFRGDNFTDGTTVPSGTAAINMSLFRGKVFEPTGDLIFHANFKVDDVYASGTYHICGYDVYNGHASHGTVTNIITPNNSILRLVALHQSSSSDNNGGFNRGEICVNVQTELSYTGKIGVTLQPGTSTPHGVGQHGTPQYQTAYILDGSPTTASTYKSHQNFRENNYSTFNFVSGGSGASTYTFGYNIGATLDAGGRNLGNNDNIVIKVYKSV